jgi:bacterioferritin-associated ferredoxin
VYICLCKGITESQVRELGRAGICSPEALARTLGLEEDGVCGRCLRNMEALMALAASAAPVLGPSTRLGQPDGS